MRSDSSATAIVVTPSLFIWIDDVSTGWTDGNRTLHAETLHGSYDIQIRFRAKKTEARFRAEIAEIKEELANRREPREYWLSHWQLQRQAWQLARPRRASSRPKPALAPRMLKPKLSYRQKRRDRLTRRRPAPGSRRSALCA